MKKQRRFFKEITGGAAGLAELFCVWCRLSFFMVVFEVYKFFFHLYIGRKNRAASCGGL
ncbi:MAG: hypothetical protein LBG72_03835 [Spirochaetaceae bacterium]|jgi:hypothetical protein|nr:hypothetical protein [Spirochaetaceae bacterium]